MKMTPQSILAAAALAGLLTGCSTAPKKECKGASCKMCAGEKSNCGAKGNCTSKATCRAKGNCSAKKSN
jgi:predicted component of type VI protein secretion system